jgi:hypothetical protein
MDWASTDAMWPDVDGANKGNVPLHTTTGTQPFKLVEFVPTGTNPPGYRTFAMSAEYVVQPPAASAVTMVSCPVRLVSELSCSCSLFMPLGLNFGSCGFLLLLTVLRLSSVLGV